MADDAEKRSLESEVMSLFEQVIRCAERAQSRVQDDSLVTGEEDVNAIMEETMRIRALTIEVDHVVRPPSRHMRSARP